MFAYNPGFACQELKEALKKCCQGKLLTGNEIREISRMYRNAEISGNILNNCIAEMLSEGVLKNSKKEVLIKKTLSAYEVVDPPTPAGAGKNSDSCFIFALLALKFFSGFIEGVLASQENKKLRIWKPVELAPTDKFNWIPAEIQT